MHHLQAVGKAEGALSPLPDLEAVSKSLTIAKITYLISVVFFGSSILLNTVGRHFYEWSQFVNVLILVSIPLTALFFAVAWCELDRNQTMHHTINQLTK